MAELMALIITIAFLQEAWNKYREAVEALINHFKIAKKYMQTPEIEALDDERDLLTRTLAGRIASTHRYPLSDEEKAAAAKLLFVWEKYRSMESRDYETNTAFVTHLVIDLKSSRFASAVLLLGFDGLVDKIDAKNKLFQAAYIARSNEMEANQMKGTTADFRKQADHALGELEAALSGMQRLSVDDATKAKLDQAAVKFNAAIDQYTRIYNRHAGLTASGGNDNNGDGGTDVPDPLDPDPTDPQKPDITNPEVPFE
jgi:hypothetical protein